MTHFKETLKEKLVNIPWLYVPIKNSYRRFFKQGYSKQLKVTSDFYQQFVGPDDLVFDVGAHFGDKTEVFLKIGCHVCAVEPQPVCAKELRTMFSRNARFVLIEKAIGATPGQATIHLANRKLAGATTMSEKWLSELKNNPTLSKATEWQELTVPMTTLDKLIEEFGLPKFCQISVMGFEREVFKGLSQRIPHISFSTVIDKAIECVRLLARDFGGEKFNVSVHSEGKTQFLNEAWCDSERMIKILSERLILSNGFVTVYVKSST